LIQITYRAVNAGYSEIIIRDKDRDKPDLPYEICLYNSGRIRILDYSCKDSDVSYRDVEIQGAYTPDLLSLLYKTVIIRSHKKKTYKLKLYTHGAVSYLTVTVAYIGKKHYSLEISDEDKIDINLKLSDVKIRKLALYIINFFKFISLDELTRD
jgi:hypothetical protein